MTNKVEIDGKVESIWKGKQLAVKLSSKGTDYVKFAVVQTNKKGTANRLECMAFGDNAHKAVNNEGKNVFVSGTLEHSSYKSEKTGGWINNTTVMVQAIAPQEWDQRPGVMLEDITLGGYADKQVLTTDMGMRELPAEVAEEIDKASEPEATTESTAFD